MPTPDLTDRLASLERELRELRALVQTAIPTPTRIPPATNVRIAKVVAPPTPDVGERPPYEPTNQPWIVFLTDNDPNSARTEEPKIQARMVSGVSPAVEDSVIAVFYHRGTWYSNQRDVGLYRFVQQWDFDNNQEGEAFLVTIENGANVIGETAIQLVDQRGLLDWPTGDARDTGSYRFPQTDQYGWAAIQYDTELEDEPIYLVVSWDKPATVVASITFPGRGNDVDFVNQTITFTTGAATTDNQIEIDPLILYDGFLPGGNDLSGSIVNNLEHWKPLHTDHWSYIDPASNFCTGQLVSLPGNDGNANLGLLLHQFGVPFTVRAHSTDHVPAYLYDKIFNNVGTFSFQYDLPESTYRQIKVTVKDDPDRDVNRKLYWQMPPYFAGSSITPTNNANAFCFLRCKEDANNVFTWMYTYGTLSGDGLVVFDGFNTTGPSGNLLANISHYRYHGGGNTFTFMDVNGDPVELQFDSAGHVTRLNGTTW